MFDQTNQTAQTAETNSIDTDTNVEMPETLFEDDVEAAAEPETKEPAKATTETEDAAETAPTAPQEDTGDAGTRGDTQEGEAAETPAAAAPSRSIASMPSEKSHAITLHPIFASGMASRPMPQPKSSTV